MQIYLIIALVIAALAIIFAIQNLAAVTVTFFFWSFQGSLALVLVLSLAAGVLISVLTSLPGAVRGRWSASGQRRRFSQLEVERDDLKRRLETAESELRELEEQVANLTADLAGSETEDEAGEAKV